MVNKHEVIMVQKKAYMDGDMPCVDIDVLPTEEIKSAVVGAVVMTKDGKIYQVYNPQDVPTLLEDKVNVVYSTEFMVKYAEGIE
jgi:hypothetical protein